VKRAWQLIDILRSLPSRELSALTDRLGIRVDQAKRIDAAAQVARALVALPEARDASLFPEPTREVLHRIAEACGVLDVASLPASIQPLVARGMVFARGLEEERVELILPIAFLLQLKPWEGEDPRGIRALLVQASPDVSSGIASYYLGRPATHPVSLSLEQAWQALTDGARLRSEIDRLAPLERKLLTAIEEVGGEVDTAELLDLEREPLRLRTAAGATPSRRGVGFALERRGFLMPVHPNRHVLPTEVAEIVGERRKRERALRRHEIQEFVLGDDHAPRRARFAEDPAPLALAMALGLRETGIEVKPNLGTPRSLVTKLATRFGQAPETVSMLAALSRAIGLWDASAQSDAVPPGSSMVAQLPASLFQAWCRGGAWDEAHPDGESLRGSSAQREGSVIGIVRSLVLDGLHELGEGWIPWQAIAGYVSTDKRTPGLTRLIERWATRSGFAPLPSLEIARRIVFESLHVLGVVDLGDVDDVPSASSVGPTLRVTARGRALLAAHAASFRSAGEAAVAPSALTPGELIDSQTLRITGGVKVADVLALGGFAEVAAVQGALDLTITSTGISGALASGVSAETIRERLAAVTPVPDSIARVLEQASAVLGRGEFIDCQGFLWVDDPEVRELLRTRRQSADLFVDPSPPGGLLIAPSVDLDRLTRRCRMLGVEVILEGEVYRTRIAPAPQRRSLTPSPEAAAKQKGPIRRQSGMRQAVTPPGGARIRRDDDV
jgi:hypothetical protein